MGKSLKRVLRDWCPPALWRLAGRLKHGKAEARNAIIFSGAYKAWGDAERNCTGYSSQEILARTRVATLKVKSGGAVFERDSITSGEMHYSFPLLAGLLRAAAANEGELHVLDFGGALGSSYFQCRTFLSEVKQLRWSIVEQPAHVACGQAEFSDDQLNFYLTIEECVRAQHPNVLLLSGVLQYLPTPYDFLSDAVRYGFGYVIVDRTAFIRNGKERLAVQHVPDWIYKASYPAWFLSKQRLLTCFDSAYDLVAEFAALDKFDPEGGEADYRGFIFERRL